MNSNILLNSIGHWDIPNTEQQFQSSVFPPRDAYSYLSSPISEAASQLHIQQSAVQHHDQSAAQQRIPQQLHSTRIPFNAFQKVYAPEKERFLFECTWQNCSKRFTRRAANSNAHWMRHTQLAPFACEHCSMGNLFL